MNLCICNQHGMPEFSTVYRKRCSIPGIVTSHWLDVFLTDYESEEDAQDFSPSTHSVSSSSDDEQETRGSRRQQNYGYMQSDGGR